MLTSGRPHRLRLHVPEGHVRAVRAAHGEDGQKRLLADVAHRLRCMGFYDVMSVMQDPTAPERCTAIARFKGPLHKDVVIRLEAAEEVAEPSGQNAPAPRGPDEGLTPEESTVMLHALRCEDNPRHLSGLASSFAPFFPIAASLLLARSNLLDLRAIGTRSRLARANGAAAAHVVDVAHARFGLPRSELLRQLLRPHEPPAGDLAIAARSLSDPAWRSVVWSPITPKEPWALRHRLRAMRDAARASGGAAAIAAATPLGGPGGPEADRARRASFADLYGRTRGRTFDERAADHAQAMQANGTDDSSTWRALLARRLAEVDAWSRANGAIPTEVVQDEVRRAVWTICSEPETLEGEPETLLFYPPEIVALARCLVREVGWGVWIVDPTSLALALPPTGREGFVSPSALQLSLATQKPHASRVWNISKVREKMSALEAEGASADALRARNQLERADRAIERRRWIEWYRRAAPMEMKRLRRSELR